MRKSFTVSCVCALPAALWMLALRLNDALFDWYRAMLARIFGVLGRISGRSALTIAEPLALGLIACAALALLTALLHALVRRSPAPLARFAAGLLCVMLPLTALFGALWPVHADTSPRAEAAYARAYTVGELEALICALDERARRDEPSLNLTGSAMRLSGTTEQLARRASDAYISAGLAQNAVVPKPARWPRWMTRMHAAGIFIPFTGEALINPHDLDSALAFTMLHEIAHSLGALREDEANLMALYAGLNSGDAELRWSSLITALRYSLGTLRALDYERFNRALDGISAAARRELSAQGAFSLPVRATSAYAQAPALGGALAASARISEPTFVRVSEHGAYDGVVYLLLSGGESALDIIRGK